VEPIATPGAFPHDLYDQAFADRVTDDGFIDYAALQANGGTLHTYLGHVAAVSPHSDPELFPTDDHALAYWLNAYNALAVQGILDRPDIVSVIAQKVEFFFRQRYRMGNEKVSLYKLENGIIRSEFGDPRIHFWLNCQSISCPAFPAAAVRPDTLDAQLDAATTAFVRNPAHVEIQADGSIAVSSIFQWYADDFGGEAGVLPFIHGFRSDVPEEGTITYKDYDWGLIQQPGKGPDA
jgi:hypothetical protein